MERRKKKHIDYLSGYWISNNIFFIARAIVQNNEVCECAYKGMSVCICLCLGICVYVSLCMCVCVYIYIYIYIYMCVSVYVCVCVWLFACERARACVCVQGYYLNNYRRYGYYVSPTNIDQTWCQYISNVVFIADIKPNAILRFTIIMMSAVLYKSYNHYSGCYCCFY